MTNTPDTAPEAVERLIAEIPGVKDTPQDVWDLQERTFATLRALSAELAALKAELAEAVRLVRILQKAAHNDRYIGQDYPVKAVDTFLARHQKETDT